MNGLWVPPGSMEPQQEPNRRPMRRGRLCDAKHCFHEINNMNGAIFCCRCDGLFERPASLCIEEKSHGLSYEPVFVPFSEWAKGKPGYAKYAEDLRSEQCRAPVDDVLP